eukprot:3348566-Pleurochrysis_carterae.AAC.7
MPLARNAVHTFTKGWPVRCRAHTIGITNQNRFAFDKQAAASTSSNHIAQVSRYRCKQRRNRPLLDDVTVLASRHWSLLQQVRSQ